MGGNVAFKVTYVYGNKGAFTSPCTPQGREINIEKLQKVWCGQPQCECNKAFRAGNTRILSSTPAPCYDSVIFRDWAFAGGVWHNGPRKNQPIPLRQVIPGKYAFFTRLGKPDTDLTASDVHIATNCQKITPVSR